jgi:hypothetical protein
MGGWMSYQRMRTRNALMYRKPADDPDPYWRQGNLPSHPNAANWGLVGDLNRMERDYLNPVYPEPPWATREPGSDPLAEVATATGVDVETVRRVLRYVFMEQL